MRPNRCGCRGKCRCHEVKDVVYPMEKDVKKTYSEETVRHIHPSHTTVVNHHTVRNEHFYPHSTSYENRVREVDVRASDEGPIGDVGGVRDFNGRDVRGIKDNRGFNNDFFGGARKGCCCKRRCRCHRPRRGWW